MIDQLGTPELVWNSASASKEERRVEDSRGDSDYRFETQMQSKVLPNFFFKTLSVNASVLPIPTGQEKITNRI
jgi:hypothetical protein